MALTETQLLDLKEKVDEAKTSVAELTGQKNALMKQLKEDWECSTIEKAETKLQEIEDSITSLDRKIKKGIAELEEKYEV